MRSATASAGVPGPAPPRDLEHAHSLPLAVTGLGYRVDGRELLAGISFVVQAGSFNIILGPNGAGKSLLLRLCHGLLRPHAGAVTWGGMSAEAARPWHAMVFQRPVMLRRPVAANVTYALRLRGLPRAQCRQRVREALEATNLLQLARAPATRLSGGEQQRLAIARAWALQPEVLLLDEPCANLDPRSTLDIETLLRALHARGTTVVMTTHDLAQARRLGERVLFLNRGRLIEDAGAEEFFAQPQSPDARAFLDGKLLA